MTTGRICMTLAFVLAVMTPANAQPGDSSAGSSHKVSNTKQMYEDIEVMRRLMGRNLQVFATHNCQRCHDTSPGSTLIGVSDWSSNVLVQDNAIGKLFTDVDSDGHLDALIVHHGAEIRPPAVEGTFLKGHGAVFNVTLPPLAHTLPAGTSKSSIKPLTEWERTRLQLRGEKAPDQRPTAHPPALSDLLLKLLAENGKNFGQLSPSESVTLVVTFRKEQAAERPGMAPG